MKAARVSVEGEDWYNQNAHSQACTARKQAWSNQGLEGEKVLMEKGTYTSIPEAMTSITSGATIPGSPERNSTQLSTLGAIKVAEDYVGREVMVVDVQKSKRH